MVIGYIRVASCQPKVDIWAKNGSKVTKNEQYQVIAHSKALLKVNLIILICPYEMQIEKIDS